MSQIIQKVPKMSHLNRDWANCCFFFMVWYQTVNVNTLGYFFISVAFSKNLVKSEKNQCNTYEKAPPIWVFSENTFFDTFKSLVYS